MDKDTEEKFVKTFIEKRLQERFLFELFSDARRGNLKKGCRYPAGISRFSHYTDICIKSKYIHLHDGKLKLEDAEKEIKKLSPSVKNCYVIACAYDPESKYHARFYDGEYLPLHEGLTICFDDPRETLLIADDKTAFIKAEWGRGSPDKYILHKYD
ncbi:hypothetical protein FACS1894211_03030 [Clostridia bacterium]|nr:hypothetical protein FACS1894211_03030 [Clostridia bacterium]